MRKPRHKRAAKKRKNFVMPPMSPGSVEALCDMALFQIFKGIIGGSSRSILEKAARIASEKEDDSDRPEPTVN